MSLRLEPEVIDTYKAGGLGWQSRIDADLRRSNKIKLPRRFVSERSSRRVQFDSVVALSALTSQSLKFERLRRHEAIVDLT